MIPQLKQQDFGLVIVDEAHHVVMPRYDELLSHLGFLSPPASVPKSGNSMPRQCSDDPDESCLSKPQYAAVESSAVSCMTVQNSNYDNDSGGSSSCRSATNDCSAALPISASQSRGPLKPNKMLVAFTATPYRRLSKEHHALHEMLPVVYVQKIRTMIEEGYLCPVSKFRF
jgi:hypothetical protein